MEFYRGLGWGLIISVLIWVGVGILLAGCGFDGDKAYPLDCPNACGHRLD